MRKTLAQIAGITAPQRAREGGQVRGPGTATSDSIPAMLSDGEFVVPADTVRKVGVRRLQDLVDMTHTPVKGGSKPNHFADGGLSALETQLWTQRRQETDREAIAQVTQAQAQAAQEQAQAAKSAQDTSMAAEDEAPVPSAGTTPASPSLESRVAQIPTGGMKAPAADGSQDRWSNTETGRNLSNIASALPGSLGGVIPAIAKTGGAISGGIDAATRLLNAGAGAAAISAIPGAASAQSPAFPPSPAGAGRGMVNPTSVNPNAPAPLSPERSPVGDRIVNGPSSL